MLAHAGEGNPGRTRGRGRQGRPNNQEVCTMFEHVDHPGLRALLSFEAARHHVAMEYR